MPEPVVSVIIPCYQQAQYLPQALESVVTQTYTHLDVIVVDDGSPENIADAIEPYLKDCRVRLIRQENAGVSAARNRGVAEAYGAHLQFLDADDWLHPEKIERQVAILEAEDDVSFVFCDFISVVNGEQITDGWKAADAPGSSEPDLFNTLWMANCMTLMSVLVRRAAFEQAGGFKSSNLTEDYELWMRLSALGYRARYLPERLGYYRSHEASRSNDGRALARRIAARVEIARQFPERVGRAAEYAREVHDCMGRELHTRIADLEGELGQSGELLANERARRAELERRQAELERRRHELIAERDALIVERDAKQAHLDWLEAQYRALSQRVAIIERSRVFQSLRLLRRLMRRLTWRPRM